MADKKSVIVFIKSITKNDTYEKAKSSAYLPIFLALLVAVSYSITELSHDSYEHDDCDICFCLNSFKDLIESKTLNLSNDLILPFALLKYTLPAINFAKTRQANIRAPPSYLS